MGLWIRRNKGNGSVPAERRFRVSKHPTPTAHTRRGWRCIHKGNILHIFTQPHSPRASNTRCSSNTNMLFHTTAWLRSISKISSPEQHICLPFLEVQHLLRSCPRFTDGEIESQRWDLTELRLQTCAPLLTHLHLISSSALTEGNINRSDSQTGQHP